jgi:hypothetical protein
MIPFARLGADPWARIGLTVKLRGTSDVAVVSRATVQNFLKTDIINDT